MSQAGAPGAPANTTPCWVCSSTSSIHCTPQTLSRFIPGVQGRLRKARADPRMAQGVGKPTCPLALSMRVLAAGVFLPSAAPQGRRRPGAQLGRCSGCHTGLAPTLPGPRQGAQSSRAVLHDTPPPLEARGPPDPAAAGPSQAGGWLSSPGASLARGAAVGLVALAVVVMVREGPSLVGAPRPQPALNVSRRGCCRSCGSCSS